MQKRNGIYYYDFWYKGVRHNKSTKERTLAKAQRVERQARNAAEAEADKPESVTMAQLGEWDLLRAKDRNEEYQATLRIYWGRFAEFFGTADKVNYASLHGYVAWRKTQLTRFGEPPGSNTLTRELKCLKRGRWLAEVNNMPVNWPIDKGWPVMPTESKRLILSARDDIEFPSILEFLANLKEAPRFQALFVIRTGVRKHEMLRITPDSFNFEHGGWVLHVIEKTTGALPRPIPVDQALVDMYKAHPDWLEAERKKAFLTASVRASIPNITLRTLRGVFSSTAGGALDAPARDALMGHLRGTAANYDRVSRERRRKVMAFVAAQWPDEIMCRPRQKSRQ